MQEIREWILISQLVLEMLAAVSGLYCVWLAVKQDILTWPVSIFSTILYLFIFLNVRLYSDSILQLVFILLQFYGWFRWSKPGYNQAQAPGVLSIKQYYLLVILILVLTFFWTGIILSRFKDAAFPFWDSFTLCISLAAIILQGLKKLENWWLWIIADIIYIPVYLAKNLYFTAVLYAVFLVLAVMGYRRWKSSTGH